MRVIQSRLFERSVRKLRKPEKRSLDIQVRAILEDPAIGQEKKGDLRGVFVHKFKTQSTQYLLSYRFVGGNLELIMLGPHENYYRNLSSHLKAR